MKKTLKAMGFVVGYVAFYLVIFKTAFYLWDNVFTQFEWLAKWRLNNPIGIVILNDTLAIPLFAILVYSIKRKSILRVSLFKRINLENGVYSLGISLGMALFVAGLLEASFMQKHDGFSVLLDLIYNSHIPAFLGFVIIGTFFKEIFFRGLLFNETSKAMPLAASILVIGLIKGFLFFQLDIPLILINLLSNLVIILLYVLTESIYSVFIAQAGNNIFIYLIRNFRPELTDFALILLSVAGICLIAFSLWNIYRKSEKKISFNRSLDLNRIKGEKVEIF